MVFFFFNYDFPQRIFAETLVENKDDFLQTFSTEKDFTRYCIFEIFACLGPELSIRQFDVLIFLLVKLSFSFHCHCQICCIKRGDIATQGFQWTRYSF